MQDVDPRVYQLVLGKVVGALRKKRKIPQEDFAKAIGVSQPTLSRIERGQSMPDALVLRRIADALGLTMDQLTQYIDEALTRTRQAAEVMTKKRKKGSALRTALAAVGIVGLAGLVGYAVAALLADYGEGKDDGSDEDE